MKDEIRAREADKYARMWQVDAYRKHSPGVKALPAFRAWLGDPAGRQVIDFGCGTGRAALALQAQGARVLGVDLLAEALDHDALYKLPFIEACLWDLPPDLSCELGYCTDVMEHIPTEKVDAVFAGIARVCREACFFQIATFPDGFGRRIGETLHETVKPCTWWEGQAQKHFGKVYVAGTKRDVQLICLR